MDLINNLNLGTGTEIALIGIICYVVTQALKQTKISNHWMPLISMLVGIIAGEVTALVKNDPHYLAVGVLGLLIGGYVSGLFDGIKQPVTAYKSQKVSEAKPINDSDAELIADAQQVIQTTPTNRRINNVKGGDQNA